MNKKEISALRKEFKEDSYKMKLKEIYNIYVKKDDTNIIYSELNNFEAFETEKKEFYFNNFKKILSSSIDTKLFELDFNLDTDNETQKLLCDIIKEDGVVNTENLDLIVNRIRDNFKYENDIMITLIKCDYMQSNKKFNKVAEEAVDDTSNSYSFILCSINKIEFSKKALIYDFTNQKLATNSATEVIINLNSPLEGFVFPAFSDGYSNVNKIMYYTSKAKEMNLSFIEEVLNCKTKFTAEDEKEYFHNILATVVGDKVKPELIQDIYTQLNEKIIESDEVQTVGVSELTQILNSNGVENTDKLEAAFDEICGSKYDFKVDNILPDINAKSIRISNDKADIAITPKDLGTIRQIRNKNGKKCILIEITDDVVINGLKLETEELEDI